MKRPVMVFALSIVFCGGLCAPPPRATESDAVLARINGEALTLGHLDEELANYRAARSKSPEATLPEAEPVLRRLVQNRLLEQEGYRLGANGYPHIQNQVRDFLRIKGIVALMDSISATAAAEGGAQLDDLMNRGNLMRRFAHILLPEETLARSLRDSLEAGADFEALARRHSTDGNAALGGDLGWAAQGSYVAPFERAVAGLPPGEITGPVETEFGWHLIKLLEERNETFGQSEAMREAMRKAAERENRMAAVRAYVAGLREKHGVEINDSLLTLCDYGSNDPEVQESLRESESVLAVLPTGRLTVAGLSRQILYQYFHGLSGREDAGVKRDEVFREWVDEGLLSYESKALGFWQRPDLLALAERQERSLLREEVIKTILELEFQPDEADVLAYYETNQARFTDPTRLKLRSVLVEDEAAGRRIAEQLEQGVQMRWLASRDPQILAGDAPLGDQWRIPADLDPALKAVGAKRGEVLGPVPHEDGNWLLAQVSAVESVEPKSLNECRTDVLGVMRREHNQATLREAMERLEAGSEIEVAPDALELIGGRLKAMAAESAATAPGAADGGVEED